MVQVPCDLMHDGSSGGPHNALSPLYKQTWQDLTASEAVAQDNRTVSDGIATTSFISCATWPSYCMSPSHTRHPRKSPGSGNPPSRNMSSEPSDQESYRACLEASEGADVDMDGIAVVVASESGPIAGTYL